MNTDCLASRVRRRLVQTKVHNSRSLAGDKQGVLPLLCDVPTRRMIFFAMVAQKIFLLVWRLRLHRTMCSTLYHSSPSIRLPLGQRAAFYRAFWSTLLGRITSTMSDLAAKHSFLAVGGWPPLKGEELSPPSSTQVGGWNVHRRPTSRRPSSFPDFAKPSSS